MPEGANALVLAASTAPVARPRPPRSPYTRWVLEPRIVFDAALAATVIELAPDTGEAPEPAEAQLPVEVEAPDLEPAPTPVPIETNGEPQALTAAASDGGAGPGAETDDLSDDTVAATPDAPARQEVVFVDARVPDPAAFAAPGREVIVLNLGEDGIAQIADALDGRSGMDAIHIVSHGDSGRLSLGSGEVTVDTIQGLHRDALLAIGQALSPEGDILIYACDYASGAEGQAAMSLWADITGADIAASIDATGHTELGGDWVLEAQLGTVETAALAPLNWQHALDLALTPVGTLGAVGLAEAILGNGVNIVSATYGGGADQAGSFTTGSGASFGSDVLGFTSGVLFTTSDHINSVAGPNDDSIHGVDALDGVDGHPIFDAMSNGLGSFDASFLDIVFVPDVPPGASAGDTGLMTLDIVFGSEDYNDYVYSTFGDAVVVQVNGVNQALVPNGLPINIDTINAAGIVNPTSLESAVANDPNPEHTSGSYESANLSLFVNNSAGVFNTQMNGFTVTIPLVFEVVYGQENTLFIGIADNGDSYYDSWLFVRADSGQTGVIAGADTVTTAANLPITVDLTANDTDLSGGTLTITEIRDVHMSPGDTATLPSGITVTLEADGQVTIMGDGMTAMTDTFTYRVTNPNGETALGSVNVTILAVNLDPPQAQDDVHTVNADALLMASVLADNGNGADVDPNGDPLTVIYINHAPFTPGVALDLDSGALLTMNSDGSYQYDPNGVFDALLSGASTTDSFRYTISDGQGGSDTATVTITVNGVAEVPVVEEPEPPVIPPPPPTPPAPPTAPTVPFLPAPTAAPVLSSAVVGSTSVASPPFPPVSSTAWPFSPVEAPPLTYAIGALAQGYPVDAGLRSPVAGLGFDPVHAEFEGQMPAGLLLGTTHENPLDHLGAPGHSVSSFLYVQRAVRHQPMMDELGVFVQRAVRASQLESALRQAVANTARWASLGTSVLPTDVGSSEPPDAPTTPEKPEAGAPAEAPDAAPASATADGARSPDAAPDRPEDRVPTTAAPGFRSQLEDSGRSQRPLNRAPVQ